MCWLTAMRLDPWRIRDRSCGARPSRGSARAEGMPCLRDTTRSGNAGRDAPSWLRPLSSKPASSRHRAPVRKSRHLDLRAIGSRQHGRLQRADRGPLRRGSSCPRHPGTVQLLLPQPMPAHGSGSDAARPSSTPPSPRTERPRPPGSTGWRWPRPGTGCAQPRRTRERTTEAFPAVLARAMPAPATPIGVPSVVPGRKQGAVARSAGGSRKKSSGMTRRQALIAFGFLVLICSTKVSKNASNV